MDEDVKVCPECDAEYFSHVDECRGCGVRLVWPGEEAPKVAKGAGDSPLVCIEEGDQTRLGELAGVLRGAGIETQILGTSQGKSCSGGIGLFVPQDHAKLAVETIDSYWLNKHPELKEMEQMLNSGTCPACGAKLGTNTTVEFSGTCPDCGLNLGGGGGGGGDCSTC